MEDSERQGGGAALHIVPPTAAMPLLRCCRFRVAAIAYPPAMPLAPISPATVSIPRGPVLRHGVVSRATLCLSHAAPYPSQPGGPRHGRARRRPRWPRW
jgi:hypothetical protein